jgi:hypothetical protein
MKEINGVILLEGFDIVRKIKAKSEHKCNLCGSTITRGENYYRYVEKVTGYERKACLMHMNEEESNQFERRRRTYTEQRKRGAEIVLETDASGSDGERWAFIAYLNGAEIHHEYNYTPPTPPEINAITAAEGYAILMAIKWLSKAEARGDIETNVPVVIGSDNDPVHTKLSTQSERGKFSDLWHELNQVLLPYRQEGKLFVEGRDCSAAHRLASKDAFESEKKKR